MRCVIRLFAGYSKPGQAKGQSRCLRVKLSAMSFIYMKNSEKGEPDYEPCKYFLIFGIPAIMIFFIVLCILGYRKTGKQIAWLQYLWEEIVIVGSIACCGFCVSAHTILASYFPQYAAAQRILSLLAFILLMVFCVSSSYSCISATIRKSVPEKLRKNVKTIASGMPIVAVLLLI